MEEKSEDKNRYEKYKNKGKMSDVNPTISMILLNINGLNNLIKTEIVELD